MSIKNLPDDKKPREKLLKHGPAFLTDTELLAIILRTGSKKENVLKLSENFLKKYNIKSLAKLNVAVLKKQFGIGDAKACQMLACFELGKRLFTFSENKKTQIQKSEDLVRIVLPEMCFLEKEHLKAIYLDSRKRIIKSETIFIGSLNESVVHPREIFKRALEENAAAIILVHNHPSGDPSPSEFDFKITKEILNSGEILGVPVLDHIIIGDKEYFSFREKRKIPNPQASP